MTHEGLGLVESRDPARRVEGWFKGAEVKGVKLINRFRFGRRFEVLLGEEARGWVCVFSIHLWDIFIGFPSGMIIHVLCFAQFLM